MLSRVCSANGLLLLISARYSIFVAGEEHSLRNANYVGLLSESERGDLIDMLISARHQLPRMPSD